MDVFWALMVIALAAVPLALRTIKLGGTDRRAVASRSRWAAVGPEGFEPPTKPL